jgi:lipopolysaccharide/colanic/teichoic acid biosynthesis glycosyltransferase
MESATTLTPGSSSDIGYDLAKRVFDIAFAGLGLVALSPVMAVVAAWIKISSPGPVLY